MSPPSPAVLLSPAVTKTSIPSLNAQKRAESYLDSPSVHISNSALSITDQSPCSFTRPVRPFDLETIAEEHGSLSLILWNLVGEWLKMLHCLLLESIVMK